MKAPKKVITAMAMAALIGGGVAPAFAADFEQSTGDPNGQGIQKAVKDVTSTDQKTVQGDIDINGTFSKTVTNLPDIESAGEYLRITMPLTLNYNYDLSNNVMNSVEGTITNESVLATGTSASDITTVDQPVKMSFVGIDNNNNDIEYVKTIRPGDVSKVQLPFKLVVSKSNGEILKNIPLVDLIKNKDGNLSTEVKDLIIEKKNNINLKIAQIDNQPIVNGDKLANGQTVSNSLTLKFEYNGK